jgi:hypothetical protein
MRIVLFNTPMVRPSGGQINARNWAFGLKSRGHSVVFFTLEAGAMAEEIRGRGIGVVTDPSLIDDEPDVLFGFGIHDALALITRFPSVPLVQVSQQWSHWLHFPCPFPQVVLHVVVDAINAEMLANEFGIPRDRIRVVHNAVDMTLVPDRHRALPVKPERAFVFAKDNGPHLDAIRAACAKRDIALEFVGVPVGTLHPNPFQRIVESDLVFGSARTAIEGAVGGAAVVVADHRGLAGMLTTGNLKQFRMHNFGHEVLTRPLDMETIGAEIDAYDPADAAAVSRFMREDASLDGQIDELEAVLREARDRFRPVDQDEHRKKLSTYLSRHLPRVGEPSPRHQRSAPDMIVADLAIARRISALDARINGIEAAERRLSALSARLDGSEAAEQRLSALSARLDRCEATEQRLLALSTRLDRFEARAAEAQSFRPLVQMARRFALLVRTVVRGER